MFPLLVAQTTMTHAVPQPTNAGSEESIGFKSVFDALTDAESGSHQAATDSFPQVLPMPDPDSMDCRLPSEHPIEGGLAATPEDAGDMLPPDDLPLMTTQVHRKRDQPGSASVGGGDAQGEMVALQEKAEKAQVLALDQPGATAQTDVAPSDSKDIFSKKAGTPEEATQSEADTPTLVHKDHPASKIAKMTATLMRGAEHHKFDVEPEARQPFIKYKATSEWQPNPPAIFAVPGAAMSHVGANGLLSPEALETPASHGGAPQDGKDALQLTVAPEHVKKIAATVIILPGNETGDLSIGTAPVLMAKNASTELLMQPPPAVAMAKLIDGLTEPLRYREEIYASNAMFDTADAPFGLVSERGLAGFVPGVPVALIGGGETARHVAQQMTAAITQHNGRTTEIALNPVELGRVRMTMSAQDGTMSLHIMAERPETTDLLRRHIETLAQQFHALGYADVTFSFNGERSPEPERDGAAPLHTSLDDRPSQDALTTSVGINRRKAGLDIRL